MNERIIDYLIKSGWLTREKAEELKALSAQSQKPLRELLSESGTVSEEQLLDALSQTTGLKTVRLYELSIPSETRQLIRPELLRSYSMIPFGFEGENGELLSVAFSDPMNLKGRDAAALISKRRIRPYLSTPTDIMLAIDRIYGTEEMKEAADLYTSSNEDELSVEDQVAQDDISSSPVVMLLNQFIEQAVRQRASDIHIEAGFDSVRVRFRVDGVLYVSSTYSLKLLPAIVARVKIMSGLDISEKRKPQDGRFSITIDKTDYEVRVSTLPTVYGEKCVLRLQRKKGLKRSKELLGLSEDGVKKFDRIMRHPYGLVLVTGPTGSGKSTTLYTVLSELNSEKVNIVTVEDPVEANIEGVNQVQVNAKTELNFANSLRSILRQDPDIIMIGEIRDSETASIAVQASITGHLVASTLHTNDTASSITRLLDMGVEGYLIADATVGVVAQRLVRKLCPYCKKPHRPDAYEAGYLRLSEAEAETIELFEPVGCQRCGGTGYYERTGVFEIMEITPAIRVLISVGASSAKIREKAVEEGMSSLEEQARRLVLSGITSLGEMKRIKTEDENDLPGAVCSAAKD